MRGVDGEFRPPTLKGMAVVYIKDMNIYCEVCDCHIKKIGENICKLQSMELRVVRL